MKRVVETIVCLNQSKARFGGLHFDKLSETDSFLDGLIKKWM
jgi:hypothetical protein